MNDPSSTPSLRTRRFERILLVKPSSLGDIIHALPLLHGLRTRYPDASISWLVAEPFAPLIAGHPQLDDVILFDRKRYSMVGRTLEPSVAFIEFVHALRARRFDLVIDAQGLFRSGFLAMSTGAAVRIGFAATRELAWVFYTHRVRVDDPDLHAAEKNCRLGRPLNLADEPLVFDLAVTSGERETAGKLLADAGVDPTGRFLAVLPGARWETKRWPASRFAALIDRAARELGIPAVLLGSPDERELCDAVACQCDSKPANLTGQTQIRDLVAILDRASAVVTHDSAPMHIAAALGRPLVAILGPTNRHRTGPYQMPSAVIQADLDCVPCYLKRLSQCPYDHECMQTVDVAEVIRGVAACVAPVADRRGDPPDRFRQFDEKAC